MKYSHPTLLNCLYFTTLQIGKFSPRIKIHYSDPSVDRLSKLFNKSNRSSRPYHMVFQGERGRGSSSHRSVSAKKKHKKKILNYFCGGAFICRFSLSMEVFETQSLQKARMSVIPSTVN